MQTAQIGDQVTVVYAGFLANGELFESSSETGPLTFGIGDGSVMPAFEAAVIGMTTGETKNIRIPAKNAYGERNEELVHTVPRSAMNSQAELNPGMVVGMTMERDGQSQKVPATVTAVVGDQITIDFNHPLAGQELMYKLTLESLNAPDDLGGSNFGQA